MTYFRKVLLAAIAITIINCGAHASDFARQELLNSAQSYANKYGTKVIGSDENSGCNPILVIPDDDGKPFAVLKDGQSRYAESFIYRYAEAVGLTDVVAPSYSSGEINLPNNKKYWGTIEAFVPVIPSGYNQAAITPQMRAFIEKYQDPQGALTLMRFNRLHGNKRCEEDYQFLFNNMNKENLDKAFVLYVLMHLADLNNRNVLLTLNADQKFEVRVIDTEGCFVRNPRYQTCVLGFPQAGEPITDSVRALIPRILAQMPAFADQIRKVRSDLKYREGSGGYEQQHDRMQALQRFLQQFPQASPRALIVFAFWNTFTNECGDFRNVACENLSPLSYGGISYYNLEKKSPFERKVYDLFDYGFNSVSEGIQAYHEANKGKLASFTDMLKALAFANREKKQPSLSDLLAFVDPHLLELASYPLNNSGAAIPFTWGQGFSAEPTQVWTNGKKSDIKVPVLQKGGRVKSITFRDTHALISDQRKQVLFVTLNGEQVGEYHYTAQTPTHHVEVFFPEHLTGTAKIKFRMPFACHPNKFDTNNHDPRKLAVCLTAAEVMFYKRHMPYTTLLLNAEGRDQYRLGNVGEGVPFPFPIEGFAHPEDSHRWTDGSKAAMKIPVKQDKGRLKSVILKDTAAFLPEGHEQHVIAFLNNEKVGEYHYKSGSNEQTIEIGIPTQLRGDAEIKFDIPFTRQPAGDPRDLGIRAQFLDLVYYTLEK